MGTRGVGGGLFWNLHWEGHSGWSLGAATGFQGSAHDGAGSTLLCEIEAGTDACEVLELPHTCCDRHTRMI